MDCKLCFVSRFVNTKLRHEVAASKSINVVLVRQKACVYTSLTIQRENMLVRKHHKTEWINKK